MSPITESPYHIKIERHDHHRRHHLPCSIPLLHPPSLLVSQRTSLLSKQGRLQGAQLAAVGLIVVISVQLTICVKNCGHHRSTQGAEEAASSRLIRLGSRRSVDQNSVLEGPIAAAGGFRFHLGLEAVVLVVVGGLRLLVPRQHRCCHLAVKERPHRLPTHRLHERGAEALSVDDEGRDPLLRRHPGTLGLARHPAAAHGALGAEPDDLVVDLGAVGGDELRVGEVGGPGVEALHVRQEHLTTATTTKAATSSAMSFSGGHAPTKRGVAKGITGTTADASLLILSNNAPGGRRPCAQQPSSRGSRCPRSARRS